MGPTLFFTHFHPNLSLFTQTLKIFFTLILHFSPLCNFLKSEKTGFHPIKNPCTCGTIKKNIIWQIVMSDPLGGEKYALFHNCGQQLSLFSGHEDIIKCYDEKD